VQQITLPLAGKEAHLLHKFVSEIRAMVENVGTALFINTGEYDLVIWIVDSNVVLVWCNLVTVLGYSVWIECQECIRFLQVP
jgi:hypothetical protein